ncbi:hypothetical protein DFH07DRAFT_966583 [Mycena maculata]|uniref:Uncharacterized protein n=1 Tax=Mycena maculata TaxID=230809 RepID=A0AAD7MXC9_9AGAR|nr:hypothetical protein DFH07DRAFT_966583 [Mycena maculata]
MSFNTGSCPSFLAIGQTTEKKQLLEAQLILAQAKAAPQRKRKPKDDANKENPAKESKKKAAKPAAPAGSKRKAPAVQWSKPAFYHLTDQLLTLIESKPSYRQAFGFDKGTTGPVSTGGKNHGNLHAEIAEALFVTPKGSKYTMDDLPGLESVIKNRIGTLKTKYKEHRSTLGATRQGLVENDKEVDIEPGSNIENIWDLIKAKFPWYLRMHALMGSSPAVDRSALAHSQTHVDLSVLDGHGKKVVPVDSDDDSASDAESDKISNWDKTDDEGIQVKSEVTHASVGRAGPRGTKRKSMQEHVEEIATADRAQRAKVAEIRENGKTARAKGKFEAKSELELAKMRHQATEAERQRQHEIAMMDRQMELERIRQAGPAAFGPPQVPGGPAYGAPPPQSAYDPSLFH